MKLTGRVVKIESGDTYVDKTRRVYIKVNEADSMHYAEIRLASNADWKLDQELDIEVEVMVTEVTQ